MKKIVNIILFIFMVAFPGLAFYLYKNYVFFEMMVIVDIMADILGFLTIFPMLIGFLFPFWRWMSVTTRYEKYPLVGIFTMGLGVGIFVTFAATNWVISPHHASFKFITGWSVALYLAMIAFVSTILTELFIWLTFRQKETQVGVLIRSFGLYYSASLLIGFVTIITFWIFGDSFLYLWFAIPIALFIGFQYERGFDVFFEEDDPVGDESQPEESKKSAWAVLKKVGGIILKIKDFITGPGDIKSKLFKEFYDWGFNLKSIVKVARPLKMALFTFVIFYILYTALTSNFMDAWLVNPYTGEFIGFEPRSFIALDTQGFFHGTQLFEPGIVGVALFFMLIFFLTPLVSLFAIAIIENPTEQFFYLFKHWKD